MIDNNTQFFRTQPEKTISVEGILEQVYLALKEKGYKTGFVMWPIRTAVSGKQMTPGGATELMELLGKEETIVRIKAAIEKLS